MDKPSDARNSPRLPVTYSDLDIGFEGEFRELKMWVSGVKAKGFIDHLYSARIRILFVPGIDIRFVPWRRIHKIPWLPMW
ncbi:MAG: hypothetical protein QGF77_06200 [Candidatus Thalassarchaeaceae archaeon]|nr:hypothetical protein [Candidatus Thalassarchaeaceae archaeon]